MDAYERLAKRLGELPQGFPRTESGVEIKILKLIFSEEDAEMTLQMTPMPETAEDVAKRLNRPLDEMQKRLEGMVKKGQIGYIKMGGRMLYQLMPFIVGIVESQRKERFTKELAELMEEYMPFFSSKIGSHGPHVARVLPVFPEVDHEHKVLPYEDIREIVDKAKSFKVQNCICRTDKALIGKRCKYSLKTCIHYSMEENAYDEFNLEGDIITKEEAIKILDDAAKEGLVHTTQNVKNMPAGFLCNCCSCCCGFLSIIKTYHTPYLLASSDYVARIDREKCNSCGICKKERCPMDAISEKDKIYTIMENKCIGCGVCATTCPSHAIKLIERPVSERPYIAEDAQDWKKKKLEQ